MRDAGRRLLQSYPRLTSVPGTAEGTTLPSASVDFVTAAQAAHWFHRERARKEFVRILKPGGWCVLIWNERRTDATSFLRDYEQLLLTYGTDYKEVRHERTTATIHEFFAPARYHERVFDLRQQFDYEGAAGRLLSSSYAPLADHPNHRPMMHELQRIVAAHARNGVVEFEYNTRVYFGKLSE
jgi:SAM-dependent methyltransferase